MRRPAALSLLDALTDPLLFAPHFTPPENWRAWRVCLQALFALPIADEEEAVYTRHTGRLSPPTQLAREGWLVVGRRGGKSRIAALIAVYLACFRDYSRLLAPGERGVVMVLAADRRQARVIFRYIAALFEGIPMLRALIERRSAEALHLSNRIVIEVHTASFRSVRGYTVVAAILDEIAFWPSDESANPDTEIVNAIRPAMATVPGALLLAISSPYARRGTLWEAYRQHYGREHDPILVWQAPSRVMNPTLDEGVISAAYAADESVASAEYGAEFRRDLEAFVSREVLERCVSPGERERGPLPASTYHAFCDPSGGSADSMTLAIAHLEGERATLDALREVRPPFSPEGVVRDFAALCQTYRITRISGDRYAGEWPREAFRRHGIAYEPAEQSASDLYRDLLPLLNASRVSLLDAPRLLAQLQALERRAGRLGKDSIAHPPGAHDDLANAAAGALLLAVRALARPSFFSNLNPSGEGAVAREIERLAEARAEDGRARILRMAEERGAWFPGDT
jgi:hypothetical protein